MLITRNISPKRKATIDALELDGHQDEKLIKVLYTLAEHCDDENRVWAGARDSDTAAYARKRFYHAEEIFDAAVHAVHEGEF